MTGLIVSGGKKPSECRLKKYIQKIKPEFIIAADKGMEAMNEYNIVPDVIVGDFDSVNPSILNIMSKKVENILKFPPEKDYTDTEIAVIECMKRGISKIYLFGATGTRVDHMLGNIGLILTYKRKGIRIIIVDDNNELYLADNKKMSIKGKFGENIGFHALSDVVKNFKIRGAKYNLDGYDMHLLDPRAICNEFLDTPIEIEFESGELLILKSFD
ncbi:thiamine diphosphokinase [Clostridium sp. BJN0001]|uniref:thiamine diphosphokinase n=1 Tax=Clostridium sp. BJN0001 TaxID=2930219 RepID=UPI001FCFD241|nr:thiamine diphosphokinase [Clostridium sp. BJN0001]